MIGENVRHARYFLRVAGTEGALGIGHDSVTVAFDEVVSVDPPRVERFAVREFRFATAHQIAAEEAIDAVFGAFVSGQDTRLVRRRTRLR